MKTHDFYFDLPPELIAQTPIAQRDASRLLVLDKTTGATEHRHFFDLPEYLHPGDCLILNDSRVLPARLLGHRVPGGGACEILLLIDRGDNVWECLVRPGKKLRKGARVSFGDGELTAEIAEELPDGNRLVRFFYEGIFLEVLDRLGKMPLPPYIKEELQDRERYQTVYSRFEGSVAAPTAGLHFTPELIERLRREGVRTEEVTLHVGAGTFLPVKTDNPLQHTMHTEHFEVTAATVRRLAAAAAGRHIVAVGTTSVRTLESLPVLGWRILREGNPHTDTPVGQWEAYDLPAEADGAELLGTLASYMEAAGTEKLQAATQIMIMPGFTYRLTSGMITNFHQPKSTLLLLVSAFIGEEWRRLYDYALSHGFRFLSYGDSSLLLP